MTLAEHVTLLNIIHIHLVIPETFIVSSIYKYQYYKLWCILQKYFTNYVIVIATCLLCLWYRIIRKFLKMCNMNISMSKNRRRGILLGVSF